MRENRSTQSPSCPANRQALIACWCPGPGRGSWHSWSGKRGAGERLRSTQCQPGWVPCAPPASASSSEMRTSQTQSRAQGRGNTAVPSLLTSRGRHTTSVYGTHRSPGLGPSARSLHTGSHCGLPRSEPREVRASQPSEGLLGAPRPLQQQ